MKWDINGNLNEAIEERKKDHHHCCAMDELIEKSCEETTRQLLELARTFARKSRRLSTQLTCMDLRNALECMNIFSHEKTFLNSSLEIQYK